MDYYEALNLRPEATVEEVEQAYRQLARKVHPDFHPEENESAETRMKMLNLIRDTLTDPERRAKYDSELRELKKANRQFRQVIAAWFVSGWKQSWCNQPIAIIAVAGLLFGITLGVSFLYRHKSSVPSSSPLGDPLGTALPSFPGHSTSTSMTPMSDTPAKPSEAPFKSRPRVVQVGSDLSDVLQVLGNPDRVEEDSSQALRILYYGKLRLILKNGKLVQGLTPP